MLMLFFKGVYNNINSKYTYKIYCWIYCKMQKRVDEIHAEITHQTFIIPLQSIIPLFLLTFTWNMPLWSFSGGMTFHYLKTDEPVNSSLLTELGCAPLCYEALLCHVNLDKCKVCTWRFWFYLDIFILFVSFFRFLRFSLNSYSVHIVLKYICQSTVWNSISIHLTVPGAPSSLWLNPEWGIT